MAATPDGKELFAVGSDKKLKQFEDSSGAGTQMVKEIDTKVLVTQICLPNGEQVLGAHHTCCLCDLLAQHVSAS